MMKTVLICAKSWSELLDAVPILLAMGIVGRNILFVQLEEGQRELREAFKKITQLPYFYDVVSSDENAVDLCDTTVRVHPNAITVERGNGA